LPRNFRATAEHHPAWFLAQRPCDSR